MRLILDNSFFLFWMTWAITLQDNIPRYGIFNLWPDEKNRVWSLREIHSQYPDGLLWLKVDVSGKKRTTKLPA
jgi:hypothetical protein